MKTIIEFLNESRNFSQFNKDIKQLIIKVYSKNKRVGEMQANGFASAIVHMWSNINGEKFNGHKDKEIFRFSDYVIDSTIKKIDYIDPKRMKMDVEDVIIRITSRWEII